MKRVLTRILAVLLVFALIVPVSAADAAEEDCGADKVVLLVIPRSGRSLAALAALAGAAVDDYALTEAGQTARSAANRLLDRVLARAGAAAHCCTETARWTAALVGLAVEVDEADIPELRAAGDLAPAGERFDVYETAYYRALDADDGEEIETASTTAAPPAAATPTAAETEPVSPDLVVNLTEQALVAAGDGTVIALLDTGFDADARYFTLPEGAKPALTGDRLTARLALIGRELADEGQDEEKIPFLYNYYAPGKSDEESASHGTRVAALAAANQGDEYDGSAPGAQLLMMKVFGSSSLAREEVILSPWTTRFCWAPM